MNLKKELKKMEVSDLRIICRELGISCPKIKSSIIKKLLTPLKKSYKIQTRSVVIYTLSYCGYCKDAKSLLNEHKLKYDEFEIDDNPDNEKKLLDHYKKVNKKNMDRILVPQIFIKNIYIGGLNELQGTSNNLEGINKIKKVLKMI